MPPNNPQVSEYASQVPHHKPQHIPEYQYQPPAPSSRQTQTQIARNNRQTLPSPSYVPIEPINQFAVYQKPIQNSSFPAQVYRAPLY